MVHIPIFLSSCILIKRRLNQCVLWVTNGIVFSVIIIILTFVTHDEKLHSSLHYYCIHIQFQVGFEISKYCRQSCISPRRTRLPTYKRRLAADIYTIASRGSAEVLAFHMFLLVNPFLLTSNWSVLPPCRYKRQRKYENTSL